MGHQGRESPKVSGQRMMESSEERIKMAGQLEGKSPCRDRQRRVRYQPELPQSNYEGFAELQRSTL